MEENKFLKSLFYIGVLIFILAVCWWLLREPNVHDQRDAAADVRGALERTGNEQRNAQTHIERIERGLDDSIRSVDTISKRIDDAANAINSSADRRRECEEIIGDSESRIEESRRIIQEVRSGARSD